MSPARAGGATSPSANTNANMGADAMSNSRICPPAPLDVHFHVFRPQLHQLAPGGGLALAHQLGDLALGAAAVEAAQPHLQQPARVGIQRGLPQLLGVHLAQALEAADAPGAFAHAVLA